MNELIAAIEIARKKVDDLGKHPRNPREHPAPGSTLWEVLKRSLQHAYFEPLVWNRRNGCLVSGHLRLAVLIDLGYTHVDVSVVDVDEITHCAMMIAANRQVGKWEEDMLAVLATEIDASGIDAALALYDHKALLGLVDCPVVNDDTEHAEELLSKAEQLQRKWRVSPGDLYQIGDHRLLCGPCEDPTSWQLLLGDRLADVLWCDPPYNVAYDRAEKKQRGEVSTSPSPIETLLNDDLPPEKYVSCLNAWIGAAAARLKRGGAFYIAHADCYTMETRQAARAAGLKVAQCLIWVKQAWTLGRQDHQWQHEPILYGWREGAAHYWQGGFSHSTVIDDQVDLKKLSKAELVSMVNHLRNGSDTTVIREPRNSISELHPTIKPVRLVARQIWNSSRRGETVMEITAGSGTTVVASEQTKRRCVATELDPKYASVILERMNGHGLTIEKVHESN